MREWLKKLRENADLSQSALAHTAGISQNYYCYIEIGERRPSVQVAKKIAEALNFDWTLFFPDQENSA